MTGRARVVQANQSQDFIAQNNRNHQQRARPQTLRKEAHLVIVLGRGSVIQSDWLPNVEMLRKGRHVNRNARVQTRRHGFRRAPFVADAQLAFRRQLDDVAAIDFHHAAQFRHNNLQKRVQVD